MTGRSGPIEFRLEAGQDTAFGEVMMYPEIEPYALQQPDRMQCNAFPEPLTIGCSLQTVFQGRIEEDVITGEFQTLHEESGQRVSGRCSVRRTIRLPDR